MSAATYFGSDFSRRALLTGAGAMLSAPAWLASASLGVAAAASQSFQPGFNLQEALDLARMCNVLETPGAPKPDNWDVVYTSPDFTFFDEKWQLWRAKSANGPYAIAIRGTVFNNIGSIVEDALALLIKAQATITFGSRQYGYKFAADPKAGLHLGFALAALMLAEHPVNGVLAQFKALKIPPGSQVFIAGHSQGASVATLLRSYLHYNTIGKDNLYKTYVFAQPKPGNDYYAFDFESLFSNQQLAYRVTNSLDWVPQVPFTIELLRDLNTPNPLNPNEDAAVAAALRTSRDQVVALINRVLSKQIDKLRNQTSAVLRNRFPKTPIPNALIEDIIRSLLIQSLNFAGAASEIALIGKPCQGGPDKCDSWYQHHLYTYEALMRSQLRM